ncbi:MULTISPECIES: hypothetical protein [unclassified Streptomyces]|uniref:hypothetical protein n=1 Tax=unclassified Streptomyces TaxID=2593676 RepID=UPI0024A9A3EA|nr:MULTISPECIES: hypothetical protein [unclassified Streptomyces]
MTPPARLPLLFLDVDGPLIPFGSSSPYPTFETGPEDPGARENPLLARINPQHGPRLTALPCELLWATTWMEDANTWVAPRIGLPPLPVVGLPGSSGADGAAGYEEEEEDLRNGLHWKTRTLVARAADRPFVWVDDEITGIDRSWVAVHHPGPALLHRVEPWRGLGDSDYAVLDAWLRRRAVA